MPQNIQRRTKKALAIINSREPSLLFGHRLEGSIRKFDAMIVQVVSSASFILNGAFLSCKSMQNFPILVEFFCAADDLVLVSDQIFLSELLMD